MAYDRLIGFNRDAPVSLKLPPAVRSELDAWLGADDASGGSSWANSLLDTMNAQLGVINGDVDTLQSDVTAINTALTTKADLVNNGSGRMVVPQSQIDIARIGETLPAASQAAMLALVAQPGDVAVRSDNATVWMLMASPASVLGNWINLSAGASGVVVSVNGRTGTVTLSKTDVALADVDNTSDANKPVSTAQAAAIATKVSKVAGNALLYGTDATGNEFTRVWSSAAATANTFVSRATGGVIKTGTPLVDADATTKLYVDTAVAGKVSNTQNAAGIWVGAASALPATGVAGTLYFTY